MHDVSIEREEVRGLFVLGVIAALLTARGFPDFPLSQVLTFHTAMNGLVMYWGLYVFFMALGVSPDWIDQDIAKGCYDFAKYLFIAGIGVMCGTVVVVVLSYLFPTFVSTRLGLAIVWVLAVLVAGAVGWKLAPKKVSGREKMPLS